MSMKPLAFYCWHAHAHKGNVQSTVVLLMHLTE